MLDCKQVYEFLAAKGISFYAGVPDSLLKEICACISALAPAENHLIAANEGGAVALAAGHHLSTGGVGLVYMQNSGLGNAVNPLISLADRDVYGIPMLLLIGWRGEPGVKDEPQHLKQGKITREMLDVMGIPHATLPDSSDAAKACLETAIATASKDKAPFAILVKSGTFAPFSKAGGADAGLASELTREKALESLLALMDPAAVVVSTTGVTSRELFELREKSGAGHGRDCLTVGSMGHCSQIALGLARGAKGRTVYCIDGDGAALMHLGGFALIGTSGPANLKHALFNNGAHESVGGQPTAPIDFSAIAKGCGYKACWTVSGQAELEAKFREFSETPGPVFLEIKIRKGSRKDLGRPTTTPRENKDALMEFLGT